MADPRAMGSGMRLSTPKETNHLTSMQTTLDFLDDRLAAARKVAGRRQTTLAAMIELSLRQQLIHEEAVNG